MASVCNASRSFGTASANLYRRINVKRTKKRHSRIKSNYAEFSGIRKSLSCRHFSENPFCCFLYSNPSMQYCKKGYAFYSPPVILLCFLKYGLRFINRLVKSSCFLSFCMRYSNNSSCLACPNVKRYRDNIFINLS